MHRKWSNKNKNQHRITQGNGLHRCQIRQVLLYLKQMQNTGMLTPSSTPSFNEFRILSLHEGLYSNVCLFVCFEFIVQLKNFSLMETSPLPVKVCKFWPLLGTDGSEGSLMCHTHWDTGLPFIIMVIKDPWHSHLMPSVWQWDVTICRDWGSNPDLRHARQTLYLYTTTVVIYSNVFSIFKILLMTQFDAVIPLNNPIPQSRYIKWLN